MRKKTTVAAILALVLAGTVMMTGCGNNTATTPVNMVIVASVHGNAPRPDLLNPNVMVEIGEVVKSGGKITLMTVEGEPRILETIKYKGISGGYTKQTVERNVLRETQLIASKLNNVTAQGPEVNTLKALEKAANYLLDSNDGSIKKLLVLDSGISTTGILDFQNNLINATPQYIVDKLKEQKALPNLTGVDIDWFYIGVTEAPQEELGPLAIDKLKAIWRAIIVAGGCEDGIKDSEPAYSEPQKTKYKVTTVAFPEPPVISGKNTDFGSGAVSFTESEIRFRPDSPEFYNSKAAKESLKGLAGYMKSHLDFTILLAGTTASGEDRAFCLTLSKMRSESVKSALVSMGIDANRIKVVGLGFENDPWHISPDRNASGDYLKVAAENRKVVVLPLDSEQAKELI